MNSRQTLKVAVLGYTGLNKSLLCTTARLSSLRVKVEDLHLRSVYRFARLLFSDLLPRTSLTIFINPCGAVQALITHWSAPSRKASWISEACSKFVNISTLTVG